MQKPMVTTSTVQPNASVKQSMSPSTISNQPHPVPPPSTTVTVTEQPKAKLPQLPPRVQSQSSITSRGPPPAIPPRSNIAPPQRAGSVQVPMGGVQRTLVRQSSANSIPPQYTPQAPPKFVIPQRQNSRTSLGRSGSISSGSNIGGGSSDGSPKLPRRH